MSLTAYLAAWKLCIDQDDFSDPAIVRSHFNELYRIFVDHIKPGYRPTSRYVVICTECSNVADPESHVCSP